MLLNEKTPNPIHHMNVNKGKIIRLNNSTHYFRRPKSLPLANLMIKTSPNPEIKENDKIISMNLLKKKHNLSKSFYLRKKERIYLPFSK